MIPSKTLNDVGAGEGSYGAGGKCLRIAEPKPPGNSVIRLYDSGEAENKRINLHGVKVVAVGTKAPLLLDDTTSQGLPSLTRSKSSNQAWPNAGQG